MLQRAPMYSYIPVRDVARARAFYEGTLGWKPARELDEAIAATVDWYQANRAWWEPLKHV